MEILGFYLLTTAPATIPALLVCAWLTFDDYRATRRNNARYDAMAKAAAAELN